jgi:hypothetical protein
MPPERLEMECLLLEAHGSGFKLIRVEDGLRSEFFLTMADLICLSHMIQDKIRPSS